MKFRCPLCFEEVADSQLNDHMQICEFYSSEENTSLSQNPLPLDFNLDLEFECGYAFSPNFHTKTTRTLKTFSKNFQSIAICPICSNNFSHNFIPLLLPNCGHTICRSCLSNPNTIFSSPVCPVCGVFNNTTINKLPVNYALLELKNIKKCSLHNLEYVAYCKTEECIICGACILDHKNHDCVLLSDQSLEQEAQKRKALLLEKAEKLINSRRFLLESRSLLNLYIDHTSSLINSMKLETSITGKLMIKDIKSGSIDCIKQLLELELENIEEILKLRKIFKKKIETIDKEIKVLNDKFVNFNGIPTAEKLANHEIPKDFITVIDITPALNSYEKLKTQLDYKTAIKNHKFF